MPACLTVEIRENHLDVACKFPEQLTAGPAGWRRRIGWRDDRDAAKRAMALGQRLEERDTLGAYGEPVRRILDVAACHDGAIDGFERRTDLEVRELGTGMLACTAGRIDQRVHESLIPLLSIPRSPIRG